MEFVKPISKLVSVDNQVVEEDVKKEDVLTQESPQQQESVAVKRPQ